MKTQHPYNEISSLPIVLMGMLTLFLCHTMGCANMVAHETTQRQKSADDWFVSDDDWEDRADGDESNFASEAQKTDHPWSEATAEDESMRSDEEEDDVEIMPAHHSQTTIHAGDICASGCIWSSYAVNMGAQSGEVACGQLMCACVRRGDIRHSCVEGSETHNQQNNQPEDSPTHTDSQSEYSAHVGGQIADAAYAIAIQRNTTGYCYAAAADAIESVIPPFLYGMSAYMAADQLAGHGRFTEVNARDLRSLPAGAVVVWSRGTSRDGHISIALGDGWEASDHIAPQMTAHYGGGYARVFLPR